MANNKLKIIAKAPYWRCSNMDLLAPIEEEGECYLLSNDEVLYVAIKNGVLCLPNYEDASEEEIKEFAREKRKRVFKGDAVKIVKGKFKGEVKVVARYFEYIVPNTYGHIGTDYLVFTDGTKTNIMNCINEKYGNEVFYCDNVKEVFSRLGGRVAGRGGAPWQK